VREVDPGPYCLGGPARTPHVVAQAILPARGKATLVAPGEEGNYRLFVRGGASTRVEVRAGAPSAIAIDVAALAVPTESPPQGRASSPALQGPPALVVAPGGAVAVTSAAAEEKHVKLERATWPRKAATAREVTAMPGFRRQFSSEVLRPGLALKVSRVGLFFSDLTGSTALYSAAGDAAAFKLVQDHFDVLVHILEENGGTLVKTIGDAVMAAFSDDVDGLVASLAVLRAFEDFRARDELCGRTHIKLGVFGGPCFAITANGVLDYFGQTANIAARLQAEARGDELVVEAALADHAIRAGVLDPGLVRETYAATLNGVDRPLEVARIALR
jgi:adenylate cyclase